MSVKRVIVIDDSALIRALLTEVLNQHPELEVVATAADPYDARDKIKRLNPDVLTLDVEMPKMDGISFLKNLMRLRPMPVVMVSTLTQQGADITIQALEIGAVDFVPKPTQDVANRLQQYAEQIAAKVRAAADANVCATAHPPKPASQPSLSGLTFDPHALDLILIGSSTGGTEALKQILSDLPKPMPPILIAQHIKPVFSHSFAVRMNSHCPLEVAELQQPQVRLQPGQVFIAPGDQHLVVKKSGGSLYAALDNGPEQNRHKPSVDTLFFSALELPRVRMLAVLLTGMGRDGAQGMLALKQAGALTIGQDESSCVVYGMPRAAAELGATQEVIPLHKIAPRLIQCCYKKEA